MKKKDFIRWMVIPSLITLVFLIGGYLLGQVLSQEEPKPEPDTNTELCRSRGGIPSYVKVDGQYHFDDCFWKM